MQMSENAGKVVDEVKGVAVSEGLTAKRRRSWSDRWVSGSIFYSCNT